MDFVLGAALALALVAMVLAAWLVLRPKHVCPALAEVAVFDRPDEMGEHRYPRVDEFDGLWETWICRHCGIHHKRKRPGL